MREALYPQRKRGGDEHDGDRDVPERPVGRRARLRLLGRRDFAGHARPNPCRRGVEAGGPRVASSPDHVTGNGVAPAEVAMRPIARPRGGTVQPLRRHRDRQPDVGELTGSHRRCRRPDPRGDRARGLVDSQIEVDTGDVAEVRRHAGDGRHAVDLLYHLQFGCAAVGGDDELGEVVLVAGADEQAHRLVAGASCPRTGPATRRVHGEGAGVGGSASRRTGRRTAGCWPRRRRRREAPGRP